MARFKSLEKRSTKELESKKRATIPTAGQLSWKNKTEKYSLYNARWKRLRIKFLDEHPLCEECKRSGFVKEADIVDHIVPHRGDLILFWDEGNWQALCKPCHDRKTASGL